MFFYGRITLTLFFIRINSPYPPAALVTLCLARVGTRPTAYAMLFLHISAQFWQFF